MDATPSPVYSVGYQTGFAASGGSDETPAYGRDRLAGALGAPLTAAGDNRETCGEDRISMTPKSRFVFDGTVQIVFWGEKEMWMAAGSQLDASKAFVRKGESNRQKKKRALQDAPPQTKEAL